MSEFKFRRLYLKLLERPVAEFQDTDQNIRPRFRIVKGNRPETLYELSPEEEMLAEEVLAELLQEPDAIQCWHLKEGEPPGFGPYIIALPLEATDEDFNEVEALFKFLAELWPWLVAKNLYALQVNLLGSQELVHEKLSLVDCKHRRLFVNKKDILVLTPDGCRLGL